MMKNYRILKPIGVGAQATSYLVENTKEHCQYVLKSIPLAQLTEYEKKEAHQEARVLMTLRHPNIISYRESFKAEGKLNIVMEYASGGDLSNMISNTKAQLPEHFIIKVLAQVAIALQYCHTRKVLHRDLKTENIFVTCEQAVKLGDFGICRLLKNTCDMATTVVGTPTNLSPELIENRPYNAKSDMWALGCVLYEMCTLSKPFTGKSLAEVIIKIANPKVKPLDPQYPPELQSLLCALLHVDPAQRPSPRDILFMPLLQGMKYVPKAPRLNILHKKNPKDDGSGQDLDVWLGEQRAEIDRIQALVRERRRGCNVPVATAPNSQAEPHDNLEEVVFPQTAEHRAKRQPNNLEVPKWKLQPSVEWKDHVFTTQPARKRSEHWNPRLDSLLEKQPGFPRPEATCEPQISNGSGGTSTHTCLENAHSDKGAMQNHVFSHKPMVKKKLKKKRPSIVLTAQQREQLDLEQKRERLQKERFQKKAQAAEKEAALEMERLKNAEERKFAVEQRRKAKGGHGQPPQLLAAAALSLTPQTEEVLRKPRHPFGESTKAPPPMAPLCEERPQKPSHPVGNNPKQVPGGTKEIDAPLVNIHHNVEMIKANVRSGLDGSKSVSVDQQGNRVAHGAKAWLQQHMLHRDQNEMQRSYSEGHLRLPFSHDDRVEEEEFPRGPQTAGEEKRSQRRKENEKFRELLRAQRAKARQAAAKEVQWEVQLPPASCKKGEDVRLPPIHQVPDSS
jgi:NIMA (never in mitosis gene a)-related kinase|uniref:non-specific serine/threonine protein kinase n=1 Tax=Eutreptiella gymnastica TaxID=73025 RepID=A0A7S4GDF1_9EUGL|mmetsp:Transcript_7963/g.15461  ORF Transcript_7963/g.15461 Transcript_7963/m.15461 type:complete len:732 (-) Transcript_7963:443-2638(-)